VTTLVINRTTPIDDILSAMGASELRLDIDTDAGRGTIAPAVNPDAIDPDDYDNDTDYLYAIPGFVNRVLEARNAPLSKSKPVPEEWITQKIQKRNLGTLEDKMAVTFADDFAMTDEELVNL